MTLKLFFFASAIAAVAIGSSVATSGQAAGAPTASGPLAKPTYTAVQAKRGAAIYTANCAECHGAHLDDGQFAVALKGPSFKQHWGGGGLDGPWDLMTTQMPPTSPGSLSGQDYADVLAYILSQNDVPASDAELPPDEAALKGMAAPK